MGSVFKSKEVYKKLKYDLHNRNEMVAVRGVYISGEYRPPYYNDTGIHIYQLTSNRATVVDYRDTSTTSGEDAIVKIINFKVDVFYPTIINYTNASTEAGDDAIVKVIDFGVTTATPSLNWYESNSVSAGDDAIVKVIDFGVTTTPIPQPIVYSTASGESTPEPTLQLSSLSSTGAVVTNYTP